MDRFGAIGAKGAIRGRRGPPGRDGSIKDLCQWMPAGTLWNLWKYEETGAFHLGKTTDVQVQNHTVTSWNSRSELGKNLTSVHPATLTTFPNAIEFTGKEYYHAPINTVACITGSGYLAITFQTDSDHTQTLIGRYRKRDPLLQNFEINVTTNEIFVCGYAKNKPIQIPIMHNCRNWTTLFLQYTITPSKEMHFEYMLDADIDQKGQFSLHASRGAKPSMILGAREDHTQYFSGKIHALDIYFTENSNERIPDPISLLVSRHQKVKSHVIPPRDPDM